MSVSVHLNEISLYHVSLHGSMTDHVNQNPNK